ncbi:MAG: hypothetical protein LBG86_00495 [Puniceicoccales bacterium]|jgi:hypothetical protein|nr:hypothetical protein [Puniceicoccales bacterium]
MPRITSVVVALRRLPYISQVRVSFLGSDLIEKIAPLGKNFANEKIFIDDWFSKRDSVIAITLA